MSMFVVATPQPHIKIVHNTHSVMCTTGCTAQKSLSEWAKSIESVRIDKLNTHKIFVNVRCAACGRMQCFLVERYYHHDDGPCAEVVNFRKRALEVEAYQTACKPQEGQAMPPVSEVPIVTPNVAQLIANAVSKREQERDVEKAAETVASYMDVLDQFGPGDAFFYAYADGSFTVVFRDSRSSKNEWNLASADDINHWQTARLITHLAECGVTPEDLTPWV
jgi:hypothetical protein